MPFNSPQWARRQPSFDGQPASSTTASRDPYAIHPILPFLEDPAVTEIMLNADGCVWIDQAGKLSKTGVTMDPPKALAILRAVAGQADLQLTAQSPSLDAELRPWGARVKAAIPPITKAPVFTIRKPPARVFTLDEYVDARILSAPQAEILRAAVAAKQNILVSGRPRRARRRS